MRYLHYSASMELFLIVFPIVALGIFLFNAYKLGKLKGRTLLCIAAVLLAAAIAFFSLHTTAVKEDKAALCAWLGELSVVSAGANDWYAGGKLNLTDEDVAALLDALQGLSPESLSEGDGLSGTGDISVSFHTAAGEDLVLKQSGNTVHFTFDSSTAARFGDRNFQTDDGALLDAVLDLVD